MLQCSGCAGLVSEFAARCPACGRSVDDAVELPEPPDSRATGTSNEPYFPEFAPEPPASERPEPAAPGTDPRSAPGRTSVGRRVVPAAVAGAVLAVARLAAALTTLAGTSGSRSPLSGLTGRVVAETPAQAILAVDPARGRSTRLRIQNGSGQFAPVGSSPDGSHWMEADGRVATIDGDRVALRRTGLQPYISPTTSPAPSEPFADTGRAALILTPINVAAAEATVVRLDSGARFDLGVVYGAGGDLQTVGAFVSVPASQTAHAALPVSPDLDVELRQAGRAPVVLASASELVGDAGWAAGTPVQLAVYPNPTGDAVAVVLQPMEPVNGDIPMVVLNRHGDVLADFGDWSGPMYGSQPVWSPGGHQLAFPTYTTTGAALAVASETGSVQALAAPAAATTFSTCVWSPNSLDVVCQARFAGASQWLYATPTSNRLVPARSEGVPLAWVTGAG